jgi:hypothetical protein
VANWRKDGPSAEMVIGWTHAGKHPAFEELYARPHLKGKVGCEGIYDGWMRSEVWERRILVGRGGWREEILAWQQLRHLK